MVFDSLPAYEDLPTRGNLNQRCGWGIFGESDRLGRLNIENKTSFRAALTGINSLEPISLNWNLEFPDPGILNRSPIKHQVIRVTDGWDDYLDNYYPQGSSQWDALCHCRHPELGYYNGVDSPDEFQGGAAVRQELGIHNFSRKGISVRFVLLDVPNFHQSHGLDWSPMSGAQISAQLLQEILEFQGTKVLPGDILLIRTGWTEKYEELSIDARKVLAASPLNISGIENDEAVLSWLWNNGIVGIAADNPTLEATPIDVTDVGKFLHYRLIPLLGFLIGELFDLKVLSQKCRETSKWDGVLISAPLNVYGGVGSPANALAFI